GVALRRAQRTTARIRERNPALFASPASHVAEGELLLGENDAAAAALEATAALDATSDREERAQALWVRARADRAPGPRGDAGVASLEVASLSDTLGPRAISAAARARWNADDDAGALRLYRQVVTRHPAAPDAVEARYAIGRIQQEAGRYDDAFET